MPDPLGRNCRWQTMRVNGRARGTKMAVSAGCGEGSAFLAAQGSGALPRSSGFCGECKTSRSLFWSMIVGLLEAFDKLITEHGSSTIQKERIVQLREQLERLQHEHDRLNTEHQQVLSENQRLRAELEKKSIPDEYTEHRGALFRRLTNGTIQDEAYCPACKIPMTSLGGMLPLRCSKCKREASFTGKALHKIVSEISE